MNWDEAYANGPFIPDGESYPERWVKQAQKFREEFEGKADFGISYGAHEREVFDVFYAENSKGAVVFIHGGYWLKFDKDAWSHLAMGALARGYDVYIPSYPLCPEAHISEITQSLIRFMHALPAQTPIYLTGHSAGGHLAARMICDNVLPEKILKQIQHVLPISGLFDLRPLMKTQMNEQLGLTLDEARLESPALLEAQEMRVTAWVGGDERPEFLRQSALIANIWSGLGLSVDCVVDKHKHHFDVIEALMDEHSPLLNTLLEPA